MKTTTPLPNEFATSTTSSGFLGFAESPLPASSITQVLQYLVKVDGSAPASPRNGKLPRQLAAHNREMMDPAYHARMQKARTLLSEEMDELVPDTLAKLRLRRGMSQTKLAQRLGTSQAHIAKIEAGSVKLYWQTAIKIADALEVTLDALRPLVDISRSEYELAQRTTICVL